jgi:hypothetical protein
MIFVSGTSKTIARSEHKVLKEFGQEVLEEFGQEVLEESGQEVLEESGREVLEKSFGQSSVIARSLQLSRSSQPHSIIVEVSSLISIHPRP